MGSADKRAVVMRMVSNPTVAVARHFKRIIGIFVSLIRNWLAHRGFVKQTFANAAMCSLLKLDFLCVCKLWPLLVFGKRRNEFLLLLHYAFKELFQLINVGIRLCNLEFFLHCPGQLKMEAELSRSILSVIELVWLKC